MEDRGSARGPSRRSGQNQQDTDDSTGQLLIRLVDAMERIADAVDKLGTMQSPRQPGRKARALAALHVLVEQGHRPSIAAIHRITDIPERTLHRMADLKAALGAALAPEKSRSARRVETEAVTCDPDEFE